MVTDNLVLATSSRHGMQNLLNEAEADAMSQKYILGETKTKFQTINEKFQLHPKSNSITPQEQAMKSSTEETQLGIKRHTDQSNTSTITSRISLARHAMYPLMGIGLYGLNGVNTDSFIVPTSLTPQQSLVE